MLCVARALSFSLSLSLSLSVSPLTSVRISVWRYSIITRSVLLVVAEISDRGKGKAGKRGLQNTRIFPSCSPAHEFHAVRVSYQCTTTTTTTTTTTVSFALCVSVWIIIFGYIRIIVFGYCDQRSPPRPTSSQPIARLRPEIVIPVSVLDLSIILHYRSLRSYRRSPAAIDARSRNAWRASRAPLRLSLSIGCHLVICIRRVRERVRAAESAESRSQNRLLTVYRRSRGQGAETPGGGVRFTENHHHRNRVYSERRHLSLFSSIVSATRYHHA